MKAVGFTCPLPITDPDSLQDYEVPKPDPQGRDLLVGIEAVSVNPVDTKVRLSQPAEQAESTPRVLGWDVAGIVDSVGSDVSLFQSGDEVYYSGSLIRPGANSEYHVVDERLVAKKPASFNMAQAAALPLTAITAYEALFDRLGISQHGQWEEKPFSLLAEQAGWGLLRSNLPKLSSFT